MERPDKSLRRQRGSLRSVQQAMQYCSSTSLAHVTGPASQFATGAHVEVTDVVARAERAEPRRVTNLLGDAPAFRTVATNAPVRPTDAEECAAQTSVQGAAVAPHVKRDLRLRRVATEDKRALPVVPGSNVRVGDVCAFRTAWDGVQEPLMVAVERVHRTRALAAVPEPTANQELWLQPVASEAPRVCPAQPDEPARVVCVSVHRPAQAVALVLRTAVVEPVGPTPARAVAPAHHVWRVTPRPLAARRV